MHAGIRPSLFWIKCNQVVEIVIESKDRHGKEIENCFFISPKRFIVTVIKPENLSENYIIQETVSDCTKRKILQIKKCSRSKQSPNEYLYFFRWRKLDGFNIRRLSTLYFSSNFYGPFVDDLATLCVLFV